MPVEDSVSSAALGSKDSVVVMSGMEVVVNSIGRSLLKLGVTSSVDVGTARTVDDT